MQPSNDLAIRLRRAAFNDGLARADLDAITPLLARDAILITGTDSAVITGRKAQLLAWRREFAAVGRMVYTRSPDRIIVSPVEPIALEHGRWRGVAAGSVTSGDYTAKWRETAAGWVIEAEVYLTLA